MNTAAQESTTGGCLCGAVRYRVNGALQAGLSVCHCSQCRRHHGALGVYTSADAATAEVDGAEKLRWYHSSDGGQRGFCSVCGSKLFWREVGGAVLRIVAGSLDRAEGLKLVCHIYVDSKGDYYEISDDLPKFPQLAPRG